VKDELNVKEVKFDSNLADYATKNVYLYTPLLGKTLGKDMGAVMAAYKQGNWTLNEDGTLSIGGKILTSELFEVRLDMKDGVAGQAFDSNKAVLLLDTNVTDELKREGMARDFVRMIQTLRKDKDFDISDRIELSYQTADTELAKALSENEKYIAEQVLAIKVFPNCTAGTEGEIDGISVTYDAKVA
jgi:isoleucyl-tRNA synthetase